MSNLNIVDVLMGDVADRPMETLTSVQANRPLSLRDHVDIAMKNYFAHLDDQSPVGVYQMVLSEIEVPLLESVLVFTQGNQTRAAEVLGLNRGTLRKKMKEYGLL